MISNMEFAALLGRLFLFTPPPRDPREGSWRGQHVGRRGF